jgi:hypothetical protein
VGGVVPHSQRTAGDSEHVKNARRLASMTGMRALGSEPDLGLWASRGFEPRAVPLDGVPGVGSVYVDARTVGGDIKGMLAGLGVPCASVEVKRNRQDAITRVRAAAAPAAAAPATAKRVAPERAAPAAAAPATSVASAAPPQAPAAPFDIRIKCPKKTIHARVSGATTGWRIKRFIEKLEGIPVYDQRLFLDDMVRLEDSRPLSDYEVEPGDVLYCLQTQYGC